MNKQKLTDLIRLVVESVNEEMKEMWMSTNEAGIDPEWDYRAEEALKELDATLRSQADPDFEQVLLMIQHDFGLSDYQAFLVGENSSYPTSPDLWKQVAGGKFYKFAVKEEPPEREYEREPGFQGEAGLTSEIREQLKREIKSYLSEKIRECKDKSVKDDEPLVNPDGKLGEVTLKVDPVKKGVSLKGDWNTLPPK